MNQICIVGPGKLGLALSKRVNLEMSLRFKSKPLGRVRDTNEHHGIRVVSSYQDCSDVDCFLFAIDPEQVDSEMRAAAKVAKSGALLINLATKHMLDEKLQSEYPESIFINGKIIGSAIGIQLGLYAHLVLETSDIDTLETVKEALKGFDCVERGDVSIIPELNAIGSGEAIRTGVLLERKLEEFPVPDRWKRSVIECGAPGTLLAFSQDKLGEFAKDLVGIVKSEDRGEETHQDEALLRDYREK